MMAIPKTAYTLAVEGTGLKVTVDAGTPVSPALMLDVLRQVFMLPAAMTASVLWDLRAGETDRQLDADAVMRIAAYVRDRLPDLLFKPRTAFLVDRDRSADLARQVAFMAEALPLAAGMFQCEADALRWLAQDEGHA